MICEDGRKKGNETAYEYKGRRGNGMGGKGQGGA